MAEEILPDDLALRTGRRQRVLAQMEADDLDILVLGRQANVRYVTGAPQLWVAGTRPFAPICVFIRTTGEIHLNSSWDEGIPEEIGHDNLYGLAWNPMTNIEVLKRIRGAADARRVGTDAMSPTFAQLLPMAFPSAEIVDGEVAMKAARRIKTASEVAALRKALAVAERGLAAAVSELAAGTTEQALNGVLMEAMTAGGYSTSATQDGAWITSREHAWRVGRRDRRIADGQLVALAGGALADGYVGAVGRTWPVGEVDGADGLYRRSNDLWERLLGACRPGAPGSDLLAAYEAAGEALPPIPVAHGLGLGFDPPVISPDLPLSCADERLDPGTVLAVTAYVFEPGVGAVFSRDAILITDDGPEVLTTSPSFTSGATVGSAEGGRMSKKARPSAEEIILYEKDPTTKIATITFNRPEFLNAPTSDARLRYADVVRAASVDDDVKVVVIRGVGDDLGSGADLPEFMEGVDEPERRLRELKVEGHDVKYPPKGTFRNGATISGWYANVQAGNRPLQELKKISIVEAKGYCYGWHFYQCADADLVISSDDALFGHPSFRYYGWGPRMWTWVQMMGLRKFQEMVFTGRPFTAADMEKCNFLNKVVTRDELEAETHKYALACARNRPVDTVYMQKVFFEIYKQHQGEYMGSLLSAFFESMGSGVSADSADDMDMNESIDSGLAAAVNANDDKFPPDFRLSKKNRKKKA